MLSANRHHQAKVLSKAFQVSKPSRSHNNPNLALSLLHQTTTPRTTLQTRNNAMPIIATTNSNSMELKVSKKALQLDPMVVMVVPRVMQRLPNFPRAQLSSLNLGSLLLEKVPPVVILHLTQLHKINHKALLLQVVNHSQATHNSLRRAITPMVTHTTPALTMPNT